VHPGQLFLPDQAGHMPYRGVRLVSLDDLFNFQWQVPEKDLQKYYFCPCP
jgi:hypothetical protein